jgi:hypothetical protein
VAATAGAAGSADGAGAVSWRGVGVAAAGVTAAARAAGVSVGLNAVSLPDDVGADGTAVRSGLAGMTTATGVVGLAGEAGARAGVSGEPRGSSNIAPASASIASTSGLTASWTATASVSSASESLAGIARAWRGSVGFEFVKPHERSATLGGAHRAVCGRVRSSPRTDAESPAGSGWVSSSISNGVSGRSDLAAPLRTASAWGDDAAADGVTLGTETPSQ